MVFNIKNNIDIENILLKEFPGIILQTDMMGNIRHVYEHNSAFRRFIGKRFQKVLCLLFGKYNADIIISTYQECTRLHYTTFLNQFSFVSKNKSSYYFSWQFIFNASNNSIAIVVKNITETVLIDQEVSSLTEQYETANKELSYALSQMDMALMDVYQTNKKLAVLYKITAVVQKHLKSDLLFNEILDIIIADLNYVNASILLYDKQNEVLVCKAIRGNGTNISLPLGKGIIGSAAFQRELVFVPEVSKDSRYIPVADNVVSEVAIPLIVNDELIGIFDIQTSSTKHIKEYDLQFLQSIANQIAMTISHILHIKNIEHQAVTDGMTDLYNYRYFLSILEKEFKRAQRYNRSLSLIMIDIDYFKKFNDTYGHLIGDKVLKIVASILKNAIHNDVDYAVRYGGEEFVILMPETEASQAIPICENIRKELANYCEGNPIVEGQSIVHITLSIGISDSKYADSANELISNADSALYTAKSKNRNCICVFDSSY